MADNDGKIYITISDRRFGKNKAEADEQNKTDKQKEEEKNPLADYAKHKFFNLIETQAKQAVNYTIGNIGNFTGNYVSQTHMSEAINMMNNFINFGTAIYAGAKIAGGWGAVIAGGIQVVSKGISLGQEIYAGYVENARQNRTISQLRTRAGLNSANNGSRGTDQ